jgi:formate C-acetyltransferase
MEYIKEQDLDYILNKFHDTHKPFTGFERFIIRRDEIFSKDTGMNPDSVVECVLRQDERLKDFPHPVRKAKAFELVLKNTRISCDARDRFPGLNMTDRPLHKTLVNAWRKEVFEEIIPEIGARRTQLEKDGIVTIWPDYDHSVPVWERVLSLGFAGLREECRLAHNAHPWDEEGEAFFEGIEVTYTAIIDFIGRLADLADNTAGSERMGMALRNIRYSAPKTFYEALMVCYIYFILCEHIEGLQVRSLGNFDKIFLPFYENDLKNGINEEEIRTDLAYYFLQFTAIGHAMNNPVYLGGDNEDGSTIINELSYVFLDVFDKMGIYNPKIQIKVNGNTPKTFLLKALDMIRRGHNSIVFVSDATMRAALMRDGFSEEEARTCDVKGCYEYAVQGAFSCEMNYLNLVKPLEYALHKGYDGVTGVFAGLSSPDIEDYVSFEQLYDEYKRQLKTVIDTTIETVNSFENYFSYINPQSMISATFPSCIIKGRDAMHGGAVANISTLLCGFIADIADSLSMIKKYVFDKKQISLRELVAMLDTDFSGNEIWQKKLRLDREKYGNNRDLPDSIAVDISKFIISSVVDRPNATKRGGKWTCGFHVARMSYDQGKKTAASANGRRFGEELSKNLSASMGQNREGATAAILSATKIDATAFSSDAALDLGLHPSAVKGDDGLEAMHGLLMTFVKRGGHAMHINVFSADTLRDAQSHPEKYQDLQIRVCGWNVLWNNINKEEQDGFIRQAEALI